LLQCPTGQFCRHILMGVDHGGGRTGGQVPPEFGAGDANANCFPPPRFYQIGTKISVLWPSKYAKIRFRPGLCPEPHWGSLRRSPRHLSRLERGYPSPYSTPLGTDPPSALAMRPPEVQPDLRLCTYCRISCMNSYV